MFSRQIQGNWEFYLFWYLRLIPPVFTQHVRDTLNLWIKLICRHLPLLWDTSVLQKLRLDRYWNESYINTLILSHTISVAYRAFCVENSLSLEWLKQIQKNKFTWKYRMWWLRQRNRKIWGKFNWNLFLAIFIWFAYIGCIQIGGILTPVCKKREKQWWNYVGRVRGVRLQVSACSATNSGR